MCMYVVTCRACGRNVETTEKLVLCKCGKWVEMVNNKTVRRVVTLSEYRDGTIMLRDTDTVLIPMGAVGFKCVSCPRVLTTHENSVHTMLNNRKTEIQEPYKFVYGSCPNCMRNYVFRSRLPKSQKVYKHD